MSSVGVDRQPIVNLRSVAVKDLCAGRKKSVAATTEDQLSPGESRLFLVIFSRRLNLPLSCDLSLNKMTPWIIITLLARKNRAFSTGTLISGMKTLSDCCGLIVHVPERSANESTKVR